MAFPEKMRGQLNAAQADNDEAVEQIARASLSHLDITGQLDQALAPNSGDTRYLVVIGEEQWFREAMRGLTSS
jgi:hypothetical protein